MSRWRDPTFVRRGAIITGVIVSGLLLDQHVDYWGQTLVNAGVWGLLLWWLRGAPAAQQLTLGVCVVYATAGEIFLSLVWGLYEYRLGNIPLFVPPGHALLFMLGTLLAARLKDWIVWFVPLASAPFVLWLAATGADTFGAVLFALLLLCMVFSSARKLYAVMFVLALAMELYGTQLGNWTWGPRVAWLDLTTVNPPIAAGAFYCVLDMLVVSTVAAIRARRAASGPAAAGATPAP